MIKQVNKKAARIRRATRARKHIVRNRQCRLCVFKSARHIYVQLLSEDGRRVLTSASTLDKELREQVQNGGNIDAAKHVGALIAKRAASIKVKKVAFDRSGFKFHGRIKALADAARDGGIEF